MDWVERTTYFVLLPVVIMMYTLIAWDLGNPFWVFNR